VLAFTKQSGITGPKDLKGKTVTVLSYQDTTYYAMQGMLATVGLNKNDLKIEAAGPANSWKLWAAGKADAIVISPDIVAQGIESGLKDVTIVPVNQYFKSMAQAILASDQTIKERPALIKSLVQATLRGMKDIMDNPKTAAADFVKAFPQQAEHLAWVEQSMELYDKFVYAGQPKLGVMDEARLASLQKFYVEQGIIEKALPVKDHYTNQFVE
jgi:NitT/TauT family transport system substrate-binding protein